MKQQLATYAIQLVGYFIMSHGMASGMGKAWSRKIWSLIDATIFSLKSLVGIVVVFLSFDAVLSAALGVSAFEGLLVGSYFKLWFAALLPLFATVMFGIELAKRTIEISRS